MAKAKKNSHKINHWTWHPKSYSKQARERAYHMIELWIASGQYTFDDVMTSACNSYRCATFKHRVIKKLRRYGKRKGLI